MLASNVILIRPIGFRANPETAGSNAFQSDGNVDVAIALAEHRDLEDCLRHAGVKVTVFDPHRADIPDAVFPNNWFSTTIDGELHIYPMEAATRSLEVRPEFDRELTQAGFQVREVVDWRDHGRERPLEGTGSLVLDPLHPVVYACASSRTDLELARQWSDRAGRELAWFKALDVAGRRIYHTNVVMGVGETVAVACLECVRDPGERSRLRTYLTDGGRELIEIDYSQLGNFAGNVIFLAGRDGETMFASKRAWASLSRRQRDQLEQCVTPVPVGVDNLESIGGGSVRCMIAENFLPRRQEEQGKDDG